MSPTSRKRLLAALCLALLTVTAGCSFLAGDGGPSTASPPAATDAAPTATAAASTPTDLPSSQATAAPTDAGAAATPESGEELTVRGNLSVDVDRIFERVERLHGVDVDPPTVVVFESRDAGSFESNFYGAFGLTGTVSAAGQATRQGTVYIESNVSMPERVLAHEFAHHVHSQRRWRPSGLWRVTADERQAATAVSEGSAVFATDAYANAPKTDVPLESDVLQYGYNRSESPFRVFTAKYIVGAEYVESQVDSPSELSTVLRDPPETTEELLHPDRSVSLGNLTVAPNESADWTVELGHYPSDADRRGELIVREFLRLELDRKTADAAADGWDNDRSLTFSATADENRTAIAWTLRWENATEADEFAAAFDRFATRRSANASLSFASERVAPETVVVFAGDESFVHGATARGTNESVRIAAPGRSETASATAARSDLSG
ncbi:hypothetical protein [Halosimplex amylolyticum]|uniref:hypothetical protein n=1 Tax=Halosimplex amylolyticum TaxID=3396616 RepID=UPI003F54C882